jgi:hypothetical protein
MFLKAAIMVRITIIFMRLCIIESFILPFHQGKGAKDITIHGIEVKTLTRLGECTTRDESLSGGEDATGKTTTLRLSQTQKDKLMTW